MTKTLHVKHAGPVIDRPRVLPLITPEDLIKGEFTSEDGKRFCYTGWLLHIFLHPEYGQYVGAYREFRLATMDRMYAVSDKDNLDTPQARADAFNSVAQELGYDQEPTEIWLQRERVPV